MLWPATAREVAAVEEGCIQARKRRPVADESAWFPAIRTGERHRQPVGRLIIRAYGMTNSAPMAGECTVPFRELDG